MRFAQLYVCMIAVFVCSSVLQSQALAQRTKLDKKPMVDLFVVVDIDGELSVMKRAEQVELSKKVVVDFKESLKAYATAKKEAAKNKEKFEDLKPVMQKVKVMGKTYKTEELAQAQLEKLQEAREKLKERRESLQR